MEQLTSIDAAFIQSETPNLPMHITTVSIYDPTSAPHGTVRFKDIMQLYEDAIYDVPLLRRRLVEVPGNRDFPYWIEDPDFDIEFHVRHIALPQPGDWRQFYIQTARLHSRGLDMSRPLWEVYVIEGLNNLDGIPPGSFAVVQKLHHAAVDGESVQKMFLAMHTFNPEPPKPSKGQKAPLLREERPGKVPLILKSYQRSLGRPAKLGKTAVKLIKGMRKIGDARKRGEIGEGEAPPITRFNGDVSASRVVTAVRFEFAEFKKLRYAVPGATINDLAISILGGAVRMYLKDKKESVKEALIVQVPVNIRAESQKGEDGNKITSINVSSNSDIADPLKRLTSVTASTGSAKKRLAVMGEDMMKDMADALGPRVTKGIMTAMENTTKIQAISSLMPGGPNFAFSNMPGPPLPVYLSGAQNVWGIGLGPMMPNMGLFVTGTSAIDKFVFGVTACRDMMPDPEFFQQCLQSSYDESKKALGPLAAKNDPNVVASEKNKKAKAAAKGKSPAKKAKAKAKPKAKAKAKTKPKAKTKAKPKSAAAGKATPRKKASASKPAGRKK